MSGRTSRASCAALAWQSVQQRLESWHGPAPADAADRPFAARELQEMPFTAKELRISALLTDGAYGQAVSAAQDLVTDDPLRESAWDLLMRALYLPGRHAEAVQQYDTVHQLLCDQLGVKPGPTMSGRVVVERQAANRLKPPTGLETRSNAQCASPAKAPNPAIG
ncbi:BTAD domain-containing putative transcriptional regulator [Streptomyces sp. NPDC001177]